MSSGMNVEKCWNEEKHDKDMVHINTQMDLLTEHLLSGNTEKLKAIVSQSRVDFLYKEEANYLNNHEFPWQ